MLNSHWLSAGLVMLIAGAAFAQNPSPLPTEHPGMIQNHINPGWYGWIGNHAIGGYYDQAMDADFLRSHHVNWYWLSHQWVVPFLVADLADVRQTMIDESRRARIWVELYWWGDHSTWEGFVAMNYPGLYERLQTSGVPAGGDNLQGKDWFDLAENPAVMASVKKTIKWQLDMMAQHLGPDVVYGVMLSEEEPDHGIYVTGNKSERYDRDRAVTRQMLARLHNELYDYVKSLYPNVKVSPGLYPAWVDRGTLRADAVVMDNYPPPNLEEEYFQNWQKAYGDIEEQYVLLWGYGNLDYRLETQRLEKIIGLYLKHGTKNIGFFRPELTLRDPIFRYFDTLGVGSYAPYDLEEHRASVTALADETGKIAGQLGAIVETFCGPNVSAASSRQELCDQTDQVYAYRKQVLESTYEKVLVMRQWEQLGRLITLAGAEGWLSEQLARTNVPDARQIGQWEMLSKEYRSLPAFYDAVLPVAARLKQNADVVAATLPDSPAQLERAAKSLLAGDYAGAYRHAAEARNVLVNQKAEKSWEVYLEFHNPYPYVLNCETTLTAEYADGTTSEIYRGMPFEISPGPSEKHTFYLPKQPVALTLATGSWSGNLRVKALRVFNSRQAPQAVSADADHVDGAAEFIKDTKAGFMLTPWASMSRITLRY